MPTTRTVFCTALLLNCAAMIILGLTGDVVWFDVVAVVLAAVAAVGLVAYALPWVRLPFEEDAFLIAGAAGFLTALLYLTVTDDPSLRRAAVSLLLLNGAVAGYGAHLSEGGDRGG